MRSLSPTLTAPFKLPLRVLGIMAAVMAFVATPASAESPTGFMQRVANDLLAASRSGSGADSAFASTIRSHADVPAIGLTALGSYASSLPKSDRPAYFNGMVNWMARYASKEAPKYPVAKAIVVGQSEEGTGGVYVDSRVTLKDGSSYDVRWKLVKRGSVYKVRDAEVLSFEMTSALNTLFQNYISDNGGNPKSLVVALNR
jgi:phospholipid transport system substrate-binding protein